MVATVGVKAESRRHRRTKLSRTLVLVLLGLICVIQFFPLYYLFTYALKTNEEIFVTNPIGLPIRWMWSNYTVALTNGNVSRYFFNSVIVSAFTMLLTLGTAVMASYALTRLRWKFRSAANAILMLGLTIPVHSSLLPIFLLLRSAGMLSTYQALIIPYTAFAIPMAILMMSGFMMNIPLEMEESAFIDGSNIYRTFVKIILPLMGPGLATASIFIFIQSWNELMFAQVFISKTQYKTLPVGIKLLVSDYGTNWGQIGAGMMVATLPTLVIYLILNKKVQQSLIVGAVKG